MGLLDIFKIGDYKARIEELERERAQLGFEEYHQTRAAIDRSLP